jgi:hypothetical protein
MFDITNNVKRMVSWQIICRSRSIVEAAASDAVLDWYVHNQTNSLFIHVKYSNENCIWQWDFVRALRGYFFFVDVSFKIW